MNHIRFLTLTASEYYNIQSLWQLLKDSDSLAVSFNIMSPGITPMPAYLSSSTKRRSQMQDIAQKFIVLVADLPCTSDHYIQRSVNHKLEENIFDFYTRRNFQVQINGSPYKELVGIQIPTRTCDINCGNGYEEDLTVHITDSEGNHDTQNFKSFVQYNELITVQSDPNIYLNNGNYMLKIDFHKSGIYPKYWSLSNNKQWPNEKHVSGENFNYWEFDVNSFIYSIITRKNHCYNSNRRYYGYNSCPSLRINVI